jgi:hypothetical protein
MAKKKPPRIDADESAAQIAQLRGFIKQRDMINPTRPKDTLELFRTTPKADPRLDGVPLVFEGGKLRVERQQIILPEEDTKPVSDPEKALVGTHLRALITAFAEVDTYDPSLHHNSARPALWSDDPDFRKDIKDLLTELRRFNDFFERNATPDPATMSALRSALTEGSGIAFKRACETVGIGMV